MKTSINKKHVPLDTKIIEPITINGPPPIPTRRIKPSSGQVPISYYGPPDVLRKIDPNAFSPLKIKTIDNHQSTVSLNSINMSDLTSDISSISTSIINENIPLPPINNSISPIPLNPPDDDNDEENPLSHEIPEVTIGHDVDIKGDLEYNKLLRIDGRFHGQLLSKGHLIIGKTGIYIGDIKNLGIVVISGNVTGNIQAEYVIVKNYAKIIGNITCKSFVLQGDDIRIKGLVNIHPLAPEIIDEYDNIIIEDFHTFDNKNTVHHNNHNNNHHNSQNNNQNQNQMNHNNNLYEIHSNNYENENNESENENEYNDNNENENESYSDNDNEIETIAENWTKNINPMNNQIINNSNEIDNKIARKQRKKEQERLIEQQEAMNSKQLEYELQLRMSGHK